MKNKKIAFLLLPLLFMAQSCSLLSSPPQGGVVKSVNGGADWQFSNAVKDSKAGQISGLNIARLDFSPQSREVLYAGTYNGGLYKSEDSGATWQRILSKIFVYDFAVHPQDPKTIYVAGYYASHGKVLKTTDGGAAWQEIYNEASQENAVRAMALNPSAPNEIIIGMTSGNIIKSYDSGVSWRLANNFGDRVQDYDSSREIFRVDREVLKRLKRDTYIMHPFPRDYELPTEIDQDPRAAYFDQIQYAQFLRMGLLCLVLGQL
jgi:hypothetical protein